MVVTAPPCIFACSPGTRLQFAVLEFEAALVVPAGAVSTSYGAVVTNFWYGAFPPRICFLGPSTVLLLADPPC